MPVEVIVGPAVHLEVVGTPARVVGVPAAVGPAGPPGPGGGGEALALHLADPTPHSPYDDLPSLVLLFENGLI